MWERGTRVLVADSTALDWSPHVRMSLPPINLPPKEDARYIVHARHRRYQYEFRARDPATRTPASWGTTRVRVKRLRDGESPAPDVQEVEREEVKESFRKWWWAMADRFPRNTLPEELCFDFDKTWWVRVPAGDDDAVLPWAGALDDRDWNLDPVETMKTIRGQLSDAMKGQAPEAHPPAYVDWSAYDGHAQVVDDDWLYGSSPGNGSQ